ncbi:MAG: cytochrome c oxidase subunit II transmembrane domain-containing protein, partial [Pseudomonadota bacterium]
MAPKSKIVAAALALSSLLAGSAATAQSALDGLETIGKPVQAGTGFQPSATELARDIVWLDSMILIIITFISVFVTGLLAYCIYAFNQRKNKTPATFTHHSTLEVAWTVVPIFILVFIGAFSLPVLFKQQIIPEADVTIKVTGYQWYWGYEYVDHDFQFDSYMIGTGEYKLTGDVRAELLAAGYSEDEFLLATDTAVVVPVDKTVVMQVTGADVIHSWT